MEHWFRCVKVLVVKQLRLRLRNRKAFFAELAWPIYFFGILLGLGLGLQFPTYPAVPPGAQLPGVLSSEDRVAKSVSWLSGGSANVDNGDIGWQPPFGCSDDYSRCFPHVLLPYNNSVFVVPNTSRFVNLVRSTTFNVNVSCCMNQTELDAHIAVDTSHTAVVFENSQHGRWNYTIRMNEKFLPDLTSLDDHSDSEEYGSRACFPTFLRLNDTNPSAITGYDCVRSITGDNIGQCFAQEYQSSGCTPMRYLSSLFLYLQASIDSAIMRSSVDARIAVHPRLLPMPWGLKRVTLFSAQSYLAMYPVFGIMMFVQYLLGAMVNEKKARISENLRLMGVPDSAYWMSWLIGYGLTSFFVTGVCSVMLAFVLPGTFLPSFIMLYLLVLANICMCFVIRAFVDRPETGAGVGMLIVVGPSVIGLIDPSTLPISVVRVMALLPSAGPVWAFVSMSSLDSQNATLGDFLTVAPNDWSVADSIVMLLVGMVVWFMLAIYLNNVIPTEHGVSLPWNYLFQRRGPASELPSGLARPVHSADTEDDGWEHLGMTAAVSIRGLRKTFKGKKDFGKPQVSTVAIDGISLDLRPSEIFGLLGKNGAGKSTLISVLTGLVGPDSGDVRMLGLDLATQIGCIRRSIGMCPQQNILWDALTVREHLQLVATIKGVPSGAVPGHAAEWAKKLGLSKKINARASTLSGGQKRKLCVAIALTGSPRIVFLDEPTSGMDPASRRELWDVLKEAKKDKCVVLCTHFMDEADIVADRKAVVVRGKVRCVGSSLFLKRRFGIGYELSVEEDASRFKETDLQELMQSHVPECKLKVRRAGTTVYTVPITLVGDFSHALRALDANRNSLGVRSYGVGLTTLEEVFLAISDESVDGASPQAAAEASGTDSSVAVNLGSTTTSTEQNIKSDKNSGGTAHPRKVKQLTALTGVKLKESMRNKESFFCLTIFPLLMVILAASLQLPAEQLASSSLNAPLLQLTLRNATCWRQGMRGCSSLGMSPLSPVVVPSQDAGTGFTSWDDGPVLPVMAAESVFTQLQRALAAQGIAAVALAGTSSGNYSKLATDLYHLQSSGGKNAFSVDRTRGNARYLAAVSVDSWQTVPALNVSYTLLFSSRMTHVLPATISALHSALIAIASGNISESTLAVNVQPFDDGLEKFKFNFSINAAVLMLGMVFSFPATVAVCNAVKDKHVKIKHQLYVQGLRPVTYWTAKLLADSVIALPAFVAVLIVVSSRGIVDTAFIPPLVIQLFLWLPGLFLFAYTISFVFDDPATAEKHAGNILIQPVIYPTLALQILGALALNPSNHNVRDIVVPAVHAISTFVLVPSAFVDTILAGERLRTNYSLGAACVSARLLGSDNASCAPTTRQYFQSTDVCLSLVLSALTTVVMLGLLYLIDVLRYYRRPRGSSDGKDAGVGSESRCNGKDSDVVAEEDKVAALGKGDAAVIARGLRKLWPISGKNHDSGGNIHAGKNEKFVAVDNLSLSVERGECLGLLGPNGAGKSTTFGMLTADIIPSAGDAFNSGFNMRSEFLSAFEKFGYCPQEDTLWDDITPREHLRLFCVIKGLSKDAAVLRTNHLLASLDLEVHADKKVKELSGGNKRKLCAGMSLTGKPDIVYMDEPTSGMDVATRQNLWQLTLDIVESRECCVVLTTHSMEEAEKLATRIAIIVDGALVAIGTPQHLKSKFGSGVRLEVRCGGPAATVVRDVRRAFETDMVGAELQEEWQGYLHFNVVSDVSLADQFAQCEALKARFDGVNYSLSQPTLEQVYLSLVKAHTGKHKSDLLSKGKSLQVHPFDE